MIPINQLSYYQQLHRYIEWQTDQIRQLERRLDLMSKEVAALKQQKSINIERIEYHFDQLKVEKLDGTMNIGLSPGIGDKSIEDLAVNGKVIQTNTARSESIERIQQAVFTYLDGDCSAELMQLQDQYHVKLDDELCERMIADLHKQAVARIDFYMNSLIDEQKLFISPEMEQEVAQRVIVDIRAGIDQYMQNMGLKG